MSLRRIFGTERHEMVQVCRKMHIEELLNLCSSPSVITKIMPSRMRWAGYKARMGRKINAYMILLGKPEGRRPIR
jgi:hypothetical protein